MDRRVPSDWTAKGKVLVMKHSLPVQIFWQITLKPKSINLLFVEWLHSGLRSFYEVCVYDINQ